MGAFNHRKGEPILLNWLSPLAALIQWAEITFWILVFLTLAFVDFFSASLLW